MGTFVLVLALSVAIDPMYTDAWRINCSIAGEMAGQIMLQRQLDAPMEMIFELLSEIGMEYNRTTERIVFAAYESPRYNTEEMQNKSVMNFQNEVYLSCMQQYRAGK